jgi:hypothetical protein
VTAGAPADAGRRFTVTRVRLAGLTVRVQLAQAALQARVDVSEAGGLAARQNDLHGHARQERPQRPETLQQRRVVALLGGRGDVCSAIRRPAVDPM